MKHLLILLFGVLMIGSSVQAQKVYGTRNGKISFVSPTDEDVKAANNEVSSRLADNGTLSFSLLIKGFKFKYAEMQDHFNNEYLMSTQFPRADFKGAIANIQQVTLAKNGTYKAFVKGNLTLHGVTKPITVNGTITVKDGKITALAKFTIVMKDFKIDASSVTDVVNAEVNCLYQ
ncbi:MAG: YceI family protein [Sediminibacterium sp.]